MTIPPDIVGTQSTNTITLTAATPPTAMSSAKRGGSTAVVAT
jgi:hypothetical protein